MRKLYLIAAILLTLFTLWFYGRNPLTAKVKIHNHVYLVEVAATKSEKEKGLGGRSSLPLDHGMLFPYDHHDRFQFWMKGMQFPLDFVWISGKTIVDLTENVPVNDSDNRPVYKPQAPVDKILELNAGTIQKDQLQIGDSVVFIN